MLRATGGGSHRHQELLKRVDGLVLDDDERRRLGHRLAERRARLSTPPGSAFAAEAAHAAALEAYRLEHPEEAEAAKPEYEGPWTIQMVVVGAKDIIAADRGGTSDPFAIIELQDSTDKKPVMAGQKKPVPWEAGKKGAKKAGADSEDADETVATLEKVLELDYPPSRLHVYVCDDGHFKSDFKQVDAGAARCSRGLCRPGVEPSVRRPSGFRGSKALLLVCASVHCPSMSGDSAGDATPPIASSARTASPCPSRAAA